MKAFDAQARLQDRLTERVQLLTQPRAGLQLVCQSLSTASLMIATASSSRRGQEHEEDVRNLHGQQLHGSSPFSVQ